MTIERFIAIAAPLDAERRLLVTDIQSALSRAQDAEPGDRLDVVRYESLSSNLEAWAVAMIASGEATFVELDAVPESAPALVVGPELPDWVPSTAASVARQVLAEGGVLVIVTLPLEPGEAPLRPSPLSAPPAASSWKSARNVRGPKAVEERFEDQLSNATNGAAESITPNGIQNRILTETLRKFVNAPKKCKRIDVPVVWRDGSRAVNPFPLRCVRLLTTPAAEPDLELAFALLSVRHAELDTIVNGAWLRNSQISQPRTQAETDDLVYDISCEQLDALTGSGSRSVRLRVYQTGLEPAIVGLYRAVAAHLVAHPGSLTVVPMYFQQQRQPQRSRPARGKAASTAPSSQTTQHKNDYSEGATWTTQ